MDKSVLHSEANAPPVEGWGQPPPSYNQSQNVYPSGPMTEPVHPSQPLYPTPMPQPVHTGPNPGIYNQQSQGQNVYPSGPMTQPVHMGPNPGIYNQHQQQGQPLVVQVAVNQTRVGPHPCPVTCPSCQAFITTRVEYVATGRTHLIALLLCLFGCGLCSCIPYCVDSLKTANHYCPKCETFIGVYEPTNYYGHY